MIGRLDRVDGDHILETERLTLRRWRDSDFKPFADLNADPRVMAFFPATLSSNETKSMMKVLEEKFENHGFSFWAVALKTTHEFIGFVGLNIPNYTLPFSPCVEVGWRLSFAHWGKGYAQEAATASLRYGFKVLMLAEIVSFTSEKNFRSRRVMEKIGMLRDVHGDFNHPQLAVDHPLSCHVLYRISN